MILVVEERIFPLVPIIHGRGERLRLERRYSVCWREIGIHLAEQNSCSRT